jgi:UDP-glucose 4-epimerase
METAVKAGVKKMVFSSTAAVYQSSEEPITEDSPIGPTNVYGHTKLMTEQALEWYRSIYGLHFAVLRYFNACGALPGRGEAHQPESHLIPRVLNIALGQAESAAIFGTDYPTPDGTCIRDYIHIADLVSAHILALGALETRDKMTYNVGSGNGFSVREVIETARKVTGHAIPVVEMSRREGDSARLVASPNKIKKELGWEPKNTNMQDILSSAWEWHKTHPHGYGK